MESREDDGHEVNGVRARSSSSRYATVSATELTDFLVLAKSSGERLFERRGIAPLPSEETPWKAAGIEAAMAHVPLRLAA